MSKSIDTRVVEMKFDNSNFEKNVSTSMSTLEKLKSKLKFGDSAKSLEELGDTANKLSFNGLVGSVEAVQNKFSVLETIAVGALLKIGSQAVTLGEQLVKSLTLDQITDGWSKYEQKTSNVQTLMNSTGKSVDEVNKYLKELMWYSDETSFGFTDMTSALSTMVSSGGDIDKLIPMIEGMGNATAYAGKGAAEFSRVIYNLNQSYSQGFLSTQDWRSVEMAGAASKQLKDYLIQAAEQIGTIKKGTGDIAEWADYMKGKKITSEAMEIAFTKFAEYTKAVKEAVDNGTYETATEAMAHMSTDGFDQVAVSAFNSAQNAKSFSEAIDATKDAVSSGWMSIFEIIFGDIEESTELWSAFCDDLWEVFASGFEGKRNLMQSVLGDPWENFKEKIESTGISMEAFENEYKNVAKDHGMLIEDQIQRYGSLEAVIKRYGNNKGYITETFKRMIASGEGVVSTNADISNSLAEMEKVARRVYQGEFGNGAERVKKLTEAGYEYKTVQDMVNKICKGQAITFDDMSEAQLQSMGYTKEQIRALKELAKEAEASGEDMNMFIDMLYKPSGRELLVQTASNVVKGLVDRISLIKQTWTEVFGETNKQMVYDILEAIEKLTSGFRIFTDEERDGFDSLTKRGKKLHTIFKGLFSLFKMVGRNVKAIAEGIITIVKEFGFLSDVALDTSASFGEWLIKLNETDEADHKFADRVKQVTNIVVEFIKKIKDAKKPLMDLVERFKNLAIIKEIGDYIKSHFNPSFKLFNEESTKNNKLLENLYKIIDKIKKFNLLDGLNKILDFLEKLHLNQTSNDVEKLHRNLRQLTGEVDSLNEAGSKSTILDNMRTNFEKLGNTIKDVWTFVTTKIGEFGTDKVVALGGMIGMLYGLYKVVALLQGVLGILKSSPVSALTGMFNSIGGFFTQLKKNAKINWILKFAAAVAILAVAVAGLCAVNPDRLEAATNSILKLMGALSVVVIVVGAILKVLGTAGAVKLEKAGFALIEFAAAVAIISLALVLLSNVKIDKKGMFATIGVIMALMLIANSLPKNMSKGGLGIFAFVTALLEFLGVLWLFSKIDVRTIYKGLINMVPVIATLLIISRLMGKGGTWSAGLGLMAFVISLWMLSKVLVNIATNDKMNAVMEHLDRLLVVMGIIAAIMLATRLAGKYAKEGGIAILAISGSMYLLTGVMNVLGKISSQEIAKAELALAGLAAIIVALCYAASLFTKDVNTTGIVIALIGLGAIGIELALLASVFKENELLPVAAAIGIVLMAFAETCKKLSTLSGKFDIKTFLTLAIMLSALYAIGMILAKCENQIRDWKIVLSLATAIGIAMEAIADCMDKIQDNVDGRKFGKNKIIALAEMIAGFAALSALIALISKFVSNGTSPLSIVVLAGSTSVAILAIAEAIKIMGNTDIRFTAKDAKNFLVTCLGFAMVALAIAGLAFAMQKLNVDWNYLGMSITTLATAIAGTVILAEVLQKFPIKDPISILESIGIIILIIVAVTAVVAIIGLALEKIGNTDAIMKCISTTIDVLKTLTSGLGEAIGTFVGGIAVGIAEKAIDTADKLSEFADHLMPFFDKIGNIHEKVIDNSITLTKAASQLGSAELKMALANMTQTFVGWLTGSKDSFSDKLIDFANCIVSFGKVINDGDINVTRIKLAAEAGVALAEFAKKVPNSGGMAGLLAGNNDVDDFGEMCVSFAKSIIDVGKELAKDTSALDESLFEKASKCGTALSTFAKTISNSGGLLGNIVGDNDIDDFGDMCTHYAAKLVETAKILSNNKLVLIPDNFDLAAKCGTSMSSFAKTIESTGGYIDKLIGSKSIDDFGDKMVSFIEDLVIFSQKARLVEILAVGNAVTAGTKVVEMTKGIDPSQLSLMGDTLTDKWGKSIRYFAEDLVTFSNTAATIDLNSIGIGLSAARQIFSFGQMLEGYSFHGFQTFSSGLEALGRADVDAFCKAFEGADTRLSTAIDTMITNALASITGSTTQFGLYGTNSCAKFVEGFVLMAQNSKSKIVLQVSNMVVAIRQCYDQFRLAGENCMTKFMVGIANMSSRVRDTARQAASGAASAANDAYGSFYLAGAYCAMGFANGISANTYLAEARAREMANRASNAAAKALDEHSPSKVFYKMGAYVAQGFANGIDALASVAVKASEEMANESINGVSDAISNISEVVTDTMDFNPVITPRLDLSNIAYGVSQMNSMFNDQKVAGQMASTENNQNGVTLGSSINFTQNNYSPQALNRTEIYRQTKNQLSMMRGMVNT